MDPPNRHHLRGKARAPGDVAAVAYVPPEKIGPAVAIEVPDGLQLPIREVIGGHDAEVERKQLVRAGPREEPHGRRKIQATSTREVIAPVAVQVRDCDELKAWEPWAVGHATRTRGG